MVYVPPNLRKTLPVRLGQHAFAYVFEGSGTFRDASKPAAGADRTASPIRFTRDRQRPRRTRTTARWFSSAAATR